jgi:hypothetical protein
MIKVFTSFPRKNKRISTKMMKAPEGTFRKYERNNPATHPTKLMRDERIIILE